MEKEKQIEEIELTEVDILANDLNQHCADLAETFCGNTNCLTCLAHALIAKGYRKASVIVEEVVGEIEKINTQYCTTIASAVIKAHLEAIRKKYTEEGK